MGDKRRKAPFRVVFIDFSRFMGDKRRKPPFVVVFIVGLYWFYSDKRRKAPFRVALWSGGRMYTRNKNRMYSVYM